MCDSMLMMRPERVSAGGLWEKFPPPQHRHTEKMPLPFLDVVTLQCDVQSN